jgi:alpha-N-arabinofuranosidase
MTQTANTGLHAEITVRPDENLGEVHEHLYGANLEHIGRSIYHGHWAEMLRNRKFLGHDRMFVGLTEGLSHQNPSYGVVEPWQALEPHYDNVLCVHDNTKFYTGNQSQRITIRRADGLFHGVQQDGLVVQSGQTYALRLILRGDGQDVRVMLGDQSWLITGVADSWQEYRTELTVENADDNAVFSIAHKAEGDLWIGCASVAPSGQLDGHRRDVVEALREWGPTFLRWPGGNFASAYHWEQGIGDPDSRPGYLDPAWNLWEPNDVGADEFMALCRHVGTEPILTINMGTGTSAEAARWVEYCNGAPDTPMGRLRAANGHPEPYGVRTWFVGNEQFGNWQVGTCDAETYARRYVEFATAMLAVDETLDLIGVGVPTDLYGHWNELVLKDTGALMKKLSVHYYSIRTEKWTTPPPAEELYWPKVASAHEVCLMLDRTWGIVRAHANPPPVIAFDEWNTYVGGKPPDFFEDYGMADGLYTGALMNACLQRADWIKMSASFNLINVMGNYRVTPTKVWKTPTALVLELFTRLRGAIAVGCDVRCPATATPGAGTLPAFDAVPLIDAAATFDSEQSILYLSVVNRDPDRSAGIALNGVARGGAGRVHRVTGNGPQALNTEAEPEAVIIEEEEWPADATLLELPAHSVAIVEVRIDVAND